MGGDIDVVRAARVSTGKDTFEMDDKATSTLKYLAKNSHTSPFEMIEVKFLIDLPIYIARQLVRHRTFNLNEWSGRYSVVGEDFYLRKKFNKQDTGNKQGSVGEFTDAENCDIYERMQYITHKQYEAYQHFIEIGVSKEQARAILGINMMTRMYVKCDLHNWMGFCSQRVDSHAQYEHQLIAKQIFKTLLSMFPISVGALAKKRFNESTLVDIGLMESIDTTIGKLSKRKLSKLQELLSAEDLKKVMDVVEVI